jgi:protein TonB
MNVTGCRLKGEPLAGVAEIGYRQDGRPARVSLQPNLASRACEPVASTLLTIGLYPESRVPASGSRDTVLLLLQPDAPGCVEESLPSGVTGRPGDPISQFRQITEPRKVRDIRPRYPQAALAARERGLVVIEAVIAETGCVQSAEVVRSAGAAFDSAALRAVNGWRYAPTLLDGKPVSVVMTVTIDFSAK